MARFTPQSISTTRAVRRAPTENAPLGRDARNQRLAYSPCGRTPPSGARRRASAVIADGQRRPNRSVLAQRDRDRARVGADQRGHPLLVEPRRQVAFGEMVRRMIGDLLDDRAATQARRYCAASPEMP